MKAKDIMTTGVILIRHNDRIADAGDVMLKNSIGFLPVLKRNNIVGVITDRDIMIRGVANKARSSDKVSKYMTNTVISVTKEDDLDTVYKLMKDNKITRVLVMDEKELEGIISLSDLITHQIDDQIILDIIKCIKSK